MDPVTPLHQEPLNGDTSETPHQEPQRTSRTSPCHQQGCLVCCTPTNHVHNLDEESNSSDAAQIPPTADELPQPSSNRLIWLFTNSFLEAIQRNDVHDIENLNELYKQAFIPSYKYHMKSKPDLLTCVHLALNTAEEPPWTS